MTDPNEFLKPTKALLERRAGSICSNPSCKRPTSGPASNDDEAVNIGEAAHIRGAKPGSARYDATMTPEERRLVTNGIWLCCTCAKLIDSDPELFSVEVLFAWKRKHEGSRSTAIGTDLKARQEEQRILALFRDESPPSQQLVIDKPEFWEYLLFIELVRNKLATVRRRLNDLRDGVVHVSHRHVDVIGTAPWVGERMSEFSALVDLLSNVVVSRIAQASGPDGEPGNPEDILVAANLLRDACEALLEWEREVARTVFPVEFEDLRQRMRGWTEGLFREIEKIPAAISAPIERRIPGQHIVTVSFTAPEGMEEVGQEVVRRYKKKLELR